MAEPNKHYWGDGNDNYANAAQKTVQAAKQISKAAAEGAKSAAIAGAEATSTAAGAAVASAAAGGKAAAGVAVGTAAGGPVGAALAAAWAFRRSILKIIVCISLVLVFLVTMVVSLPAIIFNNIFRTDPDTVDVDGMTDPYAIYSDYGVLIGELVEEGHQAALAEAEEIINNGGYDYEYSMDELMDYANDSVDYDTCYILCAYSVSMEQRGTSKSDLTAKMRSIADEMFQLSQEEKEKERIIPLEYSTYSPVTVTVITGKNPYTTEEKTYYTVSGTETTTVPIDVTSYSEITVEIPVYTNGRITGTSSATYYSAGGTVTLTPLTEMVKYVAITIHPFDNTIALQAFNIDPAAQYSEFSITNMQAISNMAIALRNTLGIVGGGTLPISDVEGTGEYIWPVPSSSIVNSYFGWRRDPFTGAQSFHNGIDIDGDEGYTIVAADGGTVVLAIHSTTGYGIHCIIDHGNGTRTLYAHMSRMDVTVGTVVEQGEPIGAMGTTGRSTGDHLHFETHVGDERVDPKNYFPGI